MEKKLTMEKLAEELKDRLLDPFYDLDAVLSEVLNEYQDANGDVYVDGKRINNEFYVVSYSHPKIIAIEYDEYDGGGYIFVVYDELNRRVYILDTIARLDF